MPEPKIIGELQKSETTKIKVSQSEYNGVPRVDIREYYMSDDGEWRPTKRGVSVKEEMFDDLKKIINKVKIK